MLDNEIEKPTFVQPQLHTPSTHMPLPCVLHTALVFRIPNLAVLPFLREHACRDGTSSFVLLHPWTCACPSLLGPSSSLRPSSRREMQSQFGMKPSAFQVVKCNSTRDRRPFRRDEALTCALFGHVGRSTRLSSDGGVGAARQEQAAIPQEREAWRREASRTPRSGTSARPRRRNQVAEAHHGRGSGAVRSQRGAIVVESEEKEQGLKRRSKLVQGKEVGR